MPGGGDAEVTTVGTPQELAERPPGGRSPLPPRELVRITSYTLYNSVLQPIWREG